MACERARGVARGRAHGWPRAAPGLGPGSGRARAASAKGNALRFVDGWMEEGRARRGRVAFRGQGRGGSAGSSRGSGPEATARVRRSIVVAAISRDAPVVARSRSRRRGRTRGAPARSTAGTNQRACRSVFVLSRSRGPEAAAAGRPRPVLPGVSNGNRTRDNWSHNPVLYQLSYTHRSSRPVGLRRPGRILSSAQSAITETHRVSLFEPPPLDPATFRAPRPGFPP